MIGLGVALLVVANAIVALSPRTEAWFMDCTEKRLHTLSSRTRNILRGLDKDVAITVMMGTGVVSYDWRGEVEVGPRVRDMLRLYRAESPRVKAEIVNCYRDKTRASQVAMRLEDEVEPDSIIIECGDRHKLIPFRDLIELPSLSPGAEASSGIRFKGEAKLTEAMLTVTEEKQAVVYFLTGHGEMAMEGPSDKALNRFVIELRRDNYRMESLNLLQRREIPDDCRVLVIAGPVVAFQDDEVELLRRYLDGDGKLLVLLRPRTLGGNAAGLDGLLADYNVRLRDDQVVIAVYRDLLTGQAVGNLQVIVNNFGAHPITTEFRTATINCLLENVCPLGVVVPELPAGRYGVPTLASPYRVTPLLDSGHESWGETDLAKRPVKFDADEDAKGPLTLAVAVECRAVQGPGPSTANAPDSTDGPRLVVLGATKVASDEALEQYAGNRLLVMNCVSWLARQETKLGIPPQEVDRRELNATPSALKAVFLITVIGMPLMGILCGGLVWWARRR